MSNLKKLSDVLTTEMSEDCEGNLFVWEDIGMDFFLLENAEKKKDKNSRL